LLSSFLGSLLLDQVERTSFPDPFDLVGGQSVNRFNSLLRSIFPALDNDFDVGVQVSSEKSVESRSRYRVSSRDERVVVVVRESEREDTLLSQIGAVDASE